MAREYSVKDITAKVQLHVHLDGAIRLKTAWELSREKNIEIPGVSSEGELHSKVVLTKPETLTTFLQRFQYFAPSYVGDLNAIRRVAKEFAEDCKDDGIIYCEARYCPHLMAGSSISPESVVDAVCHVFREEEGRLGIKLRSILCIMREQPAMSAEMVELCQKYKDAGVVGLDIAGDENLIVQGCNTHDDHYKAFEDAKRFGIHRTAHAGENGSHHVVREALEDFCAERIGHGYHSLDDEEVYQTLLQRGIHLEVCPWSSIYTGATSCLDSHPAKRFALDRANFSLSTDDPTITGTKLSDEFSLLASAGVPILDLIRTNFNAARSSFLPDEEKAELLDQLRAAYSHVPEIASF